MALIQIRERSNGGNAGQLANAVVSFDHGSEYPVSVRPPWGEQTEQQEHELAWYFEQHLVHPYMEWERARQAGASIQTYGESLFTQIFSANPEVYASYKKRAEAGLSTLAFEIVGSSAFHALHWEALKDPLLPRPFALDATVLRKNLKPVAFEASVRTSPTINILVVTARPNGKQDVGYRTISLPLVEALRQADLPVQIDFVRPGTYVALEQHLAATTAQHGEGYYHVMHFDVHGAVLTYEQLQAGQQANRYLLQQRPGFDRPDLPAYRGERAFLFLQGKEVGQADPIEASELAKVLLAHQIPIALLNACQSGKVPDAYGEDEEESRNTSQAADADRRESSLGQHLMQAGVQVVLAMSYSVTVSAAERLMPELYRRLFARADLATAIRFARNELGRHKARRAYYNYQIDLEDWLLPVVYQNQPTQLGVRPLSSEEDRLHYERQATRYQEPATGYRFVGRDLDVLEIEQRLLTGRNLVLIQGMGGAGKTTLLHHLASWWQTTHLVEQVFYFGYDQRAWTREQIIRAVAEQLVGAERYKDEFQPLSPNARQEKLAALLRATRHLLILDNLESITGSNFAILNTLPAHEQEALRSVLADLAGGKTLVLLGSRSDEAWLAPKTFADNRYPLGGLDREAASTLTDLILERHHATHYQDARSPENAALRTLLKLLDGFPLALEIVLANLANQTPTEVLAALQAGEATLDARDGRDKTGSLLQCIDYSHSNLSPDAQNLLLCLAPFTSILSTYLLEPYSDRLKQAPLLAALPFERWPEVLQEARQWGLLIPDTQLPGYLHLQPVFPYFLRTRLRAPEQRERQAAIETAFQQLYDQVGYEYYTYLEAREPQERTAGQVLVQLEYENMVTALRLALEARASILDPFRALCEYLDRAQEPQRGLALAQMVQAGLQAYPAELLTGPLEEELAGVLDRVANFHLALKQYAEAEQTYLHVLAMLEGQRVHAAPGRKKQLAPIYHQLGWVAQEQRKWEQAEEYYRQALRVKEEFQDRYGQASTYHNLGVMAQEQRGWEQAEKYYEQALRIYEEFQDRYEQAGTYHNLGVVAQEQRKWEQAEEYYQQALRIDEEFQDRYEQAGTYHQLGMVAQEQRKWEQAEEYYRQALRIKEEFQARYEQARTYHQLGAVAQEQRKWEQAEEYYEQALRIKEEFQARYEQARTYHQLGIVAQERRKWEQAEKYYEQALRIYEEFQDRYEQAGTYGQLGLLAEERARWPQAQAYLLQALTIFGEYQDAYYVGITLRSLARLWRESGEQGLPAAVAAVLGITVDEVEQLLRKSL